ncbi:MAG: AAA family ATPase [Bacteroidaceae bacterium]|nr:AAA family ATPase [Bacteroidaceae bacterium]
MSKVICVLHDKGGCAKTTTVVNLAFALWLLGKKVLLVDTDQQCNLTDTIDKTVHKEAESTIYDWMHDSKSGEVLPFPIYTRYDGLDYIPGSHSMSNINAELQLMNNREHRLKEFLSIVDPESGITIRDMYDYVFIDCAPGGETLMNTNALVASDYTIVPVEASIYSLQGLPRLLAYIDKVRKQMKAHVEILGYLLVRWNPRRSISREVKAYYSDINEVRAPLIPIYIRECVRCNESVAYEMSLYEYSPDSTAADDYMRVAEYLIERKTRPHSWTPLRWGQLANAAYKRFIRERNKIETIIEYIH